MPDGWLHTVARLHRPHWSALLPLELLGLLALEAPHLGATISLAARRGLDEVEQARAPSRSAARGSPGRSCRPDDRDPDRPADERRADEAEERVARARPASAPRPGAGCRPTSAATSGTRPRGRRAGQRRDQVGHERGQLAQGAGGEHGALRSSYSARSSRPSANASASTPWMTSRSASEARSGAAAGSRGSCANEPHTSPSTNPILGSHTQAYAWPRCLLGVVGPVTTGARRVGTKREHVLVCDGRRSTGR